MDPGPLADPARLYAAIVDSSEDAIVAHDLDGVIVGWNAGAERMFGHAASAALGRPLAWLLPSERGAEAHDHLTRIRAGERTGAMAAELAGADARRVAVVLSAWPIHDHDGKIMGGTLVARDVGEHVRLEQALIRNVELQAANAVLEAFSRDLAHELRNPMTVLFGFSRALLDLPEARGQEKARDFAAKMSHAVRRMALIIDDLENLSCISTAQRRHESTDLSAMAHHLAARLAADEPERRVEFRIAEGLLAWGDPGLLRLMLGNLLRNAWKFSAEAEQTLIEFGAAEREGTPAYFVRDNGAGFDGSDAGRLFHPFARLHERERFAGTGIGLTIVERVVRHHGGRVWAEGKKGEGATFWFTLPA